MPSRRIATLVTAALALAWSAPAFAEDAAAAAESRTFVMLLFVFMLATFIGIMVISRVSRLLHTPLMSLTNAISAISVVGALLITGNQDHPWPITVLGAIALFCSMTNIVSGFLITNRMLKMFKQTKEVSR